MGQVAIHGGKDGFGCRGLGELGHRRVRPLGRNAEPVAKDRGGKRPFLSQAPQIVSRFADRLEVGFRVGKRLHHPLVKRQAAVGLPVFPQPLGGLGGPLRTSRGEVVAGRGGLEHAHLENRHDRREGGLADAEHRAAAGEVAPEMDGTGQSLILFHGVDQGRERPDRRSSMSAATRRSIPSGTPPGCPHCRASTSSRESMSQAIFLFGSQESNPFGQYLGRRLAEGALRFAPFQFADNGLRLWRTPS